ncbi:N-acetylmuramoyl-L-alanine amidase-like domain-containing protein [Aerosakkonemataceae cyanobacterium BLCC-F50]|uniref:N-acetylmuramoyl-L-alanine amidase-like domain-containing protein n=1 Tax=Floridaenema flaviceps BLCC-F50 TaxID=3153642 RepID=A0ABV4XIL6_9CYAN
MSKFFKVVVLSTIASSLPFVVCQATANRSFLPNYTPLKPQFLVGITADEIINLALQKQKDILVQKVVNSEELRFQKLMQYAQEQNLSNLSMSEIMQEVAKSFLGAEYKANLLDQQNPETLLVTLDKFDCVLFVETVLAIARGIAVKDYSYQTFVNHLQNQRYRNGELPEYCHRLHYFSDWIIDNQNRGNVQNISLDLGGISQKTTLNFMSKNRNRYPQMVNNDANYQCIVEMESHLAGLTVNYIPKYRISGVYSQLQPGDIIAVATDIPGLDFTHTGLVYRYANGRVGFIHASPAGTVTTARDLQRYVRNVKNSMGIVVVRAIDPRHLQR